MIRCERVVFDILPAVRALLAKELMKKGLTQVEVAAKLQITQPAVSQYIKQSRAKKAERLQHNDEALGRITHVAESLTSGHVLSNDEMEGLCHDICDLLK